MEYEEIVPWEEPIETFKKLQKLEQNLLKLIERCEFVLGYQERGEIEDKEREE